MKKFLKWTVILTVIAVICAMVGLAGIFWYYGQDLPHILKRDDFDPPQMTRIYSADGHVIGEFFTPGSKRTVVPENEIPKHVKDAFMAAEDADFMTHEGIDYLGMVRAFYLAVRYDVGVKGTSTITQQVVKNLILSPERSLSRKVKEIILSRELEKNLSKDDILYLYLNTIYLGHGVNGVEEASRVYFGKHVKDLTLPEGAMLAGLTQSPEGLTPFRHAGRALKRRAYVLNQLRDKGFITEAQFHDAEKTPIQLAEREKTDPYLNIAPHFVEFIRRQLVEKYGEEKVQGGGLRVETTLEVKRQEAANIALKNGLRIYDERQKNYRPLRSLKESEFEKFTRTVQKKVEKEGFKNGRRYEALITGIQEDPKQLNVKIGDKKAVLDLSPRSRIFGDDFIEKKVADNFKTGQVVRIEIIDAAMDPPVVRFAPGPEAALVAIDPKTRGVVAMVGGFDFELNKYDHATQARRQTGSTFKPLVYAAALEARVITPASIFLDSPAVFPLHGGKTWSPQNSDGDWRGPIRIREGLGASRNVIAVRVLKELGIEKAIEFARRMGIESKLVDNFTMVMGSSETTPLEMTNAYATFASGGLVAQPQFIRRVTSVKGEKDVFAVRTERAIGEDVAWLATSIMRSVVDGYTDSTGKRRGGTASSLAEIKRPVAGKTGTTNEARDAWFIGFTPQLVTGVWVGNSDNTSLGNKEYGGRVAGPIWLGFMKQALEGLPVAEFGPAPLGVVSANIDPATGKLAREKGIEEYFLTGTAPTEYAPAPDAASSDDFLLQQFGQ